ncbi:MAG TPA: ATP-binding protein [Candidatus Dormibacteraeota bacterium]|nr:ATP-binding protein [Candidatus Dormibacteraeota bacterium]
MSPSREHAIELANSRNVSEPGEEFGEFVQVALDIAGSLEPREVIARILERGLHAIHADRATLSSLIGDEVVVEATAGRAGSVTWVGGHYSVDYFAGQPLVRTAIETLQPVFGGQLQVDDAAPEFRQALAEVRRVAVLPLVHGGRAIGMLVLSRYTDRPYSPRDEAALALLGAISGLALRNARLYDEVKAARQRADDTADRLRSAVEAAEDVAGQIELDQVLIRLLERATASVGADGGSVARLEGTEMIIEATITGGAVGSRWPVAPKVLAGIKRGRPVELTAAEYTGTPEGLESIVQPYRRFLIAPLIVGGETIGLLAMGCKEDRPFDPAAIRSLQQFATLGALLLRNARLIARAQDAERAKSEFMSFAVHELRAPLTVTSGYLSMALDGGFGDLSGQLKSILQIAARKTEEAKVLADDLLTVARIEGGGVRPVPERIVVGQVVQNAMTRARPRAELAKATLTIDAPEDIQAVADPDMTGKILDNLLNNALAYNDAAPTVRVSVRWEGDQVAIAVSDDGIGVAPEDRTRIFFRFARGTDRRVLEKPGTGLGLYVSRGLARQMGGSLDLETSQSGKGSTFVLRLPAPR